jgi:hypothetical protein
MRIGVNKPTVVYKGHQHHIHYKGNALRDNLAKITERQPSEAEYVVSIGTPSTGLVRASYATSLLAVGVHFLATPVSESPSMITRPIAQEMQGRAITHDVILGSVISQAREDIVDGAIRYGNVTHLLFWDDDMGVEQDALNHALGRHQPVVIANYRKKAPPWQFVSKILDAGGAWHEVKTKKDSTGLEEVSFGGFGFALFAMEVLKAIPKPRFLPRYNEEHGRYTTEDVPFFAAVREAGFKVWCDHDLSKKVFHVGDFAFGWDTAPVRIDRE